MLAFPLDISANWHKNYGELDAIHREWLLQTGSLTARLKQEFSDFRVKVLNETTITLTTVQADIIGVKVQHALCREVLLYGDNKPRVYAQSWIPLANLSAHSTLLSLGNRPLGEFIFQHPKLERENLVLAQIMPSPHITGLLQSLDLDIKPFFARRSVFNLENVKLMVCEAFLPGALTE